LVISFENCQMFFSTSFYTLPGMILKDLSNILLKPEILSAGLHRKHQDCIHEEFYMQRCLETANCSCYLSYW